MERPGGERQSERKMLVERLQSIELGLASNASGRRNGHNRSVHLQTKSFELNRVLVTGYYADQLSVAQEIRGNHTVAVKNESRGFHLNNLSYAGPIVMGVGGMCPKNPSIINCRRTLFDGRFHCGGRLRDDF